MFTDRIETESLVLAPLSGENVDTFDLYELFAASGDGDRVFEYVPMEAYDSPKDPHDWLDEAAAEWDDGDVAKYAVFVDGETLAGVAALSPAWDRKTGSLAVLLGSDYWGAGYAGECAEALAAMAFEDLDLELVSLSYDGDNQRSKRAIETVVDRLGGQYDGTVRNWTPIGDRVVDNHRYTISRAEYRDAAGN